MALKDQRHQFPRTSPDKRSNQQVAKCMDTNPVGVVGLYVDDILPGEKTKKMLNGLMKWVQSQWKTGPEDNHTIHT
eukprot:2720346-Amphidinium_carterae.2